MAVIARKIRKPLARLLEQEARDMAEMYRHFAERVDERVRPLSDALMNGGSLTYTLSQLRGTRANIAGEIRRLTQDIEAWEKKEFPRMYGAGQLDALLDMSGGADQIGFARGVLSRQAMRLLSEEIHLLQGGSKLHKSALSVLENSLYTGANIKATVGRRYDDVFRALGLEIAGGVAAGDETWRQAMRRELDLFERMNIRSFTDKAGRNWKLSNYAEMVSRTVPMHVMNVGKMNEFLEYGEDLVVVSDFSPTCPLCAPWGGAVLSISGVTKGYPAVSEAEEAGLFHPRCLHSFALYSAEVWGKPDADGRVRHGPSEEYLEREADAGGEPVGEGRVTGASGAVARSDYKRMEKHAKRYYEAIRNRKSESDVEAIARNTGFSVEDVRKIRHHVFMDMHDLGIYGIKRFDPSFDMAVSWQNLADGKNIREMDIVLLHHELEELKLMAQGWDYDTAHRTVEKVYNYQKYVKELNTKEGIF